MVRYEKPKLLSQQANRTKLQSDIRYSIHSVRHSDLSARTLNLLIVLIDNAISRISQRSLVTAAQSDTASQVYSVVKDQVSNFAQHSKTLMNVLDAVGDVHPFIKRTSGLFSRFNIVLILCIAAVSLLKAC